jgi:lipopolysaccharide/colanic/teichoic acid biosynthesis glycosyltransferase
VSSSRPQPRPLPRDSATLDLTRSSGIVKRVFDLLGVSIGLLALSPLMIVIAVAIKLDSRGPVFFRQLRVDRHGKRFCMLKFRTMVADAEQRKDELRPLNETRGVFKMAEDPRITGVGRLLRRFSLDELPQLANVMRGEMSLVGPRPLVPDEDCQIEGHRRSRLDVKPGMTGQWQILGSDRVPLEEMVKIDYLYVTNWSLWGDVEIILRTVPHVLGRRGV